MAQSVQMRAASVGASLVLLGAAAFMAVSMRFVIDGGWAPNEPGIINTIFNPPEPPVTPPRDTTRAPPTESTIIIDDANAPTEALTEVAAEPYLGPIFADGPVTVTNPTWMRVPRDLSRYYPRRALQRQVEGAAILNCLVDVRGQLSCAVVSETPAGWGFGEAAQRIAGEHAMRPAMRDGVAVEGRCRMRVPFTLD